MDQATLMPRLRTLLAALVIAVVGMLTAAAFTLAAALLVGLIGLDPDVVTLVLLTLAITAIAFASVSIAYLSWRGVGWSFVGLRVPTVGDLAWIGGGYLLAFLAVFAAALLVVGVAGGEPAPNQVAEFGLEAPALLLLLVPANLLLVGPGEELLFRGIVQGRLRESFGPASAVVLSSAIFASIHYVALTGGVSARLTTIGILFLPSLVFGTAYERTGNLAVPALIHGLYNSTLSVLLYVTLRFADATPPALFLG